nr:hypothetical protein KitaXyl93_69080 [Kitasatospora sp. Xyl93]
MTVKPLGRNPDVRGAARTRASRPCSADTGAWASRPRPASGAGTDVQTGHGGASGIACGSGAGQYTPGHRHRRRWGRQLAPIRRYMPIESWAAVSAKPNFS